MYHHLRGTVTEKGAAHAVVEAGGVGYRVLITPRTAALLPEAGGTTLLVHAETGEEGTRLFGFAEERERAVFRLLRTVSGVGPMRALQILAGCPPEDLAAAVEGKDAARLSLIRGIGRKTSQRILTELEGRLEGIAAGADGAAAVRRDAVEALVTLGYDRKDAAERVARALAAAGAKGASVEEVVRRAL